MNIEYCDSCEDIYATNTEIWLAFRIVEAETSYSSDTTFFCPRCGNEILRHSGYLDALAKVEDSTFIDAVIYEASDLTDSAKSDLRFLLERFTVPSFSITFTGELKGEYRELIKKGYATLLRVSDKDVSYGHVTLNAYKLGLLDNLELLQRMRSQAVFFKGNSGRIRYGDGSHVRKLRVDALVNNFTAEQRLDLIDLFENKCALTGMDVPIQIDHVIPIAIGHGGTTVSNMLPVWQRINSSKGAKNIFEWYRDNGERFNVCPERFAKAIEYLADLNGMTTEEYRAYVYECHAAPNDYSTEAII